MMTVLFRGEFEYDGPSAFPVKDWFFAEEKDEWFEDKMVQEMVKDIDKTDWLMGNIFKSPVLGNMLSDELSGGVKSLILILKGEGGKAPRIFKSIQFGDNCIPWLVKLSYIRDFTMVMTHFMDLYVDTPICAQTEDGRPLHTCKEVWKYCNEEDNKRRSKN